MSEATVSRGLCEGMTNRPAWRNIVASWISGLYAECEAAGSDPIYKFDVGGGQARAVAGTAHRAWSGVPGLLDPVDAQPQDEEKRQKPHYNRRAFAGVPLRCGPARPKAGTWSHFRDFREISVPKTPWGAISAHSNGGIH